jgi:hypothetical protein
VKKLVTVYPWPPPAGLQRILDGIPDINVEQALPGGPGPVLAIRRPPPFVCDAIVVTDPERVPEAVRIVTSDGIEMVSMREMLSAVSETVEPYIGKVKFA